ncbi:C40 family peptidase [Tepidimonas sp.]|uniref:C40 family peptidase n=1 Tax=Tepidimonas sp. TaxID=2002775 RepID=UPI002FE1ECB6
MSGTLYASRLRATGWRTLSVCLVTTLSASAAIAQMGPDPIMELLWQRGVMAPLATSADDGPPPSSSPAPTAALVYALAYVGVPYQRGGTGFDEGVDCSGFVQITFRETAGVLLPRRAAEQAAVTLPIAPEALQPGDLVFFNTQGTPFSHVGIYVGDGRFIHSPRSGAQVRLERMDTPYWRTRFDGARRVPLADRAS